MIAAELLGAARRMLADPDADADAGVVSARLAAVLARQALEEIIAGRCADLGAPAPSATARGKLLVLRSLDSADAADRAALAWDRLSNACHVHAYELAPSAAEIEQLCGMVAELLPAGAVPSGA